MLSVVFWNPPTREEFGNAQLFCPGSPLGFELSKDIPNTNLQELARHALFRVCNVVIAIRKDPHPDEPAGSCRSEIACGERSSSGICLIEDGEESVLSKMVKASACTVRASGLELVERR
jgi:hypothetical protein